MFDPNLEKLQLLSERFKSGNEKTTCKYVGSSVFGAGGWQFRVLAYPKP